MKRYVKSSEQLTMNVECFAEGKTVYQVITFSDGIQKKFKIRDCNTPEQAEAVANYFNVRSE